MFPLARMPMAGLSPVCCPLRKPFVPKLVTGAPVAEKSP